MNSTLKQLRNELDELKKQVVSLERGQLADVANSESDSNVFIVPKPNTDTGELRRRDYYLHEKISERFSPSELVGFMYSLGIDPGDVPGETHHEKKDFRCPFNHRTLTHIMNPKSWRRNHAPTGPTP